MTARSGSYEYPHFRVEHYVDGTREPGVRAGDAAPSGTLETLDGEWIDHRECWADTPAVFELGSVTCHVFRVNVGPMNRLAESYADAVDFYLVYVRETHPGPRCGPQESMERTRSLAREVAFDVTHRTVLVDDLEGSVHGTFDAMPNSVYLVGREVSPRIGPTGSARTRSKLPSRSSWPRADAVPISIRLT